MAYTANSFLAAIKPYVIEDMKKSGILASLTASQALLESNKGNSGLAVKGNNLFGIKGSYNGQSVKMETTEYYGGKPFKVMADFRKYPSWAESIEDHSALFNRLDRYKNLRGEHDWKKATKYVKEDGYATAPDYTSTLQSVIQRYRLMEWDDEVLYGQPDLAPKTGNPYREPLINVKFNSRGNNVRWLQFELNRYGYRLVVDGIAGEKTISALKDFQSSHELVADGICGPLTREKLRSSQ
ncbi:MAG: glucosaminidase domain-containing protein [Oscillospiraceae bacterium]|nr:glucosaminidase domain-containing protein [Oscillospiraceae bacterium]